MAYRNPFTTKIVNVPTSELTTVYKLKFIHLDYFNVCKHFLQKREKNTLFYNWIIFLSDICWQSLHVTIYRFSGSFKQRHSIVFLNECSIIYLTCHLLVAIYLVFSFYCYKQCSNP